MLSADVQKKSLANVEVSSMFRTLFVHIPKTGGTTLDSIYSDHYAKCSTVRNVQLTSDMSEFSQINNTENRYVSGHFPIALANLNQFEEKITILRNPIDVICSISAFVKKINGRFPRVSEAIESGGKFEIYREYFSTHFDLGRFLIDRKFGIAPSFFHYAEQCEVEESIHSMDTFNYILDFDHLDDEFKTLIMEKGFFPYSSIGRKRQHSYEPDYEMANGLLSKFDDKYYAQMRSRFVKRGINVDSRYDRYKIRFCKMQGITLNEFQGLEVDLQGPIGIGWHNCELSEKGTPFRWSEITTPSIELPIAEAGRYQIYFYINCRNNPSISCRINSLIGQQEYSPSFINHGNGLSIYQVCVTINSADWIYVNWEIGDIARGAERINGGAFADERERGVILGHIYIKRMPSH